MAMTPKEYLRPLEVEMGEESLRAEIAYYRSMIADYCRNDQRSRPCTDLDVLLQQLRRYENRLEQLRRGR